MAARKPISVYLEITPRRTFAGAVDWAGWCRSGRTPDDALEALVAYGPRYAKVVGKRAGFTPPADVAGVKVSHRLKGGPTTDFGAPQVAPPSDRQPLGEVELRREITVLRAAWRAFDAALKRHAGVELRKGPRGGGRDRDAIVEHVLEAERTYVRKLGVRTPPRLMFTPEGLQEHREATCEAIRAVNAAGEVPGSWPLRYAIRRITWHVLDHAWEMQDKDLS